ncbi:hypothetical protein B0H13DRAFT_2045362, partial [Mycena leptocephala]
MSDQTYMPSSPSSVYSLGLDYEQSQHKQEIRDVREADMSPEERQAAAEQRRLKRVKLGIESPNEYQREVFSPPFNHALSPTLNAAVERSRSLSPTPRWASVKSTQKTRRHFEPQGLLDSQATSQEAVDALITVQMRNQEHNTGIADMTSQDVLDQLDYRRQPVVYDHGISEEPEDYEALRTRCFQAESERDTALMELTSARSAYQEAVVAKNRAEEEIARWERAAAAAAPLVHLLLPYI